MKIRTMKLQKIRWWWIKNSLPLLQPCLKKPLYSFWPVEAVKSENPSIGRLRLFQELAVAVFTQHTVMLLRRFLAKHTLCGNLPDLRFLAPACCTRKPCCQNITQSKLVALKMWWWCHQAKGRGEGSKKTEKGGTKASSPSIPMFPNIFHPETLHPETLLAHTFHPYTFHPETLHPETLLAHTFHPSTFHPETLHPETLLAHTFHP